MYVCLCVGEWGFVCVRAYAFIYCNRPLDTEFPASVTKMAASRLYGPFSGMVQESANTFLEISSLSQSKNKHLLSWIAAFRFYCQFAPIHTNYKLTQFTYMNFNPGAGQ
jgi:hypothetical protein